MQHSKTRGGTTGLNTKPRTSGPKVVDHRCQRAPISEKKRVGKVSELEIQLARLQEELNNTKEKLHEAESRTKMAYLEAEEAKKQLAAMAAKLNDSQKRLNELWACEESRIHELRKISQDRDRAWESELKAVQKHLATAITENQKLNTRLQHVAESEAAQAERAESAQLELLETANLVEELKIQLNESKDSESRALKLVSQVELEMVKLKEEKDENGEVELAAAMAATAGMEGELRRLKVQTEQWRKAAQVAATMVLGDGGGGDGGGRRRLVDSFEFDVNGERSNSSCCEDIEDESSIKKTGNMLKRIGVLLKKGQK